MASRIVDITAGQIADLILMVPEFDRGTTASEICDRTSGRDSQYWCSYNDQNITGFLVAYQDDEDTYYNWIMGVLPDYRKKQQATLLMNTFETYAKAQGYKFCKVKTMNRYRSMLRLLVDRSYNIEAVESDKIIFTKLL